MPCCSGTVNKRLKKILLDNVTKERNGEIIDRVLMKNCLSMLVDVNVNTADVYQEEFERDFLAETRNFYQHESQEFMSQNTVPDYLKKVLVLPPVCPCGRCVQPSAFDPDM